MHVQSNLPTFLMQNLLCKQPLDKISSKYTFVLFGQELKLLFLHKQLLLYTCFDIAFTMEIRTFSENSAFDRDVNFNFTCTDGQTEPAEHIFSPSGSDSSYAEERLGIVLNFLSYLFFAFYFS